MPHSRRSILIRYTPAIMLAAFAVALGLRVNQTGNGPPRLTPSAAIHPDLSVRAFKSPYRELREKQAAALAAARKPPVRAPILPGDGRLEPITVEEARRMIAENREFRDNSGRGRTAAEAITRLCAAGLADDAFALIDPEPSLTRNAGIKAFFESAELDESTILRRIQALPPGEDPGNALAAYLRRVPLNGIERFVSRHPELHPILKKGLTEYLDAQHAGPDREQARILVDTLHAEGFVEDRLVLRNILENTSVDPFLRFDEIRHRVAPDADHLGETQIRLIDQMAEKAPEKTLGFVLTAAQDPERPNTPLRSALEIWARNDREAALGWFRGNSTAFSNAQQDDAAWAFALSAKESGKQEEARQWLAQVKEPNMKRNLSGMLRMPDLWDFDFGR